LACASWPIRYCPGQQALSRRVVEAEGEAACRGEHGELPDLGAAGEDQGRRGALGACLKRVRRDDDLLAGQPVGDDAAE
jgi:hypothetical protein